MQRSFKIVDKHRLLITNQGSSDKKKNLNFIKKLKTSLITKIF